MARRSRKQIADPDASSPPAQPRGRRRKPTTESPLADVVPDPPAEPTAPLEDQAFTEPIELAKAASDLPARPRGGRGGIRKVGAETSSAMSALLQPRVPSEASVVETPVAETPVAETPVAEAAPIAAADKTERAERGPTARSVGHAIMALGWLLVLAGLILVIQTRTSGRGTPTASVSLMNRYTYGGRLFSPTSPWNTPATGPADPHSGEMIANLAESMTGRGLSVNLRTFAVALVYADASTPLVDVSDSTGWWPGVRAPIPPDARPDPEDDHHLVVWDVPDERLYEFWKLVKRPDGGWSAGYGVTFDAYGPGFQDGVGQNSARAYGGSLIGGAIRYQEMKERNVQHALAMAYPGVRGDAYARGRSPNGVLAIASHADNVADPKRSTEANIPKGARLRLKADVDVAARCGANTACQALGQTLQQYGAFVVDSGGAPVLFAENLSGKIVSWDGVLAEGDVKTFHPEDFEVLELPPLTSSSIQAPPSQPIGPSRWPALPFGWPPMVLELQVGGTTIAVPLGLIVALSLALTVLLTLIAQRRFRR